MDADGPCSAFFLGAEPADPIPSQTRVQTGFLLTADLSGVLKRPALPVSGRGSALPPTAESTLCPRFALSAFLFPSVLGFATRVHLRAVSLLKAFKKDPSPSKNDLSLPPAPPPRTSGHQTSPRCPLTVQSPAPPRGPVGGPRSLVYRKNNRALIAPESLRGLPSPAEERPTPGPGGSND